MPRSDIIVVLRNNDFQAFLVPDKKVYSGMEDHSSEFNRLIYRTHGNESHIFKSVSPVDHNSRGRVRLSEPRAAPDSSSI